MFTIDQATIDSTGAFYVNELERLDQTVHEPLVDITWGRDIMLREDITIGDESSSFLNSTFASMGGFRPAGKSWIGKNTSAIQRVQLDMQKTQYPLTLWGEELGYSLPELASAKQAGRPIDQQMYDGLRTKHQMDIDQQVYTGDSDLGLYGLFNSTQVTAGNVAATGTGATTQWINKTSLNILADVNTALTTCWSASAYAVIPGEMRLPPAQFGLIATPPIAVGTSSAAVSVMTFLEENNVYTKRTKKPLNIQYVKWLAGLGASGTDRFVVYTNDQRRVRFPLTDLQRTPVEYRGIHMVTTYWGRIGAVEFVYPVTLLYQDGI
jgi:hypothetical protein